ncbi:hypothetical protein CY34DRAFT_106445 [Suillus luteus UH-Slu-Lm8-n1]|uniref:Uncharacterized protein n=1 Tax=Suillus luteus UH-Slu-Lm8-n1 TaxID=930992 RepID=A0A0D0BAY2_9AGAM|nr:hypothetical protein CY34DRAFT_106445 [Suillus luteus UH-Slu-Lm8-n1]
MPAFNSKVAELASALTLQAPGADAPLDVLGDWGHEVVRFLTWLDTEERRVFFTLTAVSGLQTTFQDQVDVRRHYPWRSWGRRWLPLTAEAWEAKKQALMASPVIEDPLASIQLSSPAVVTLPESSNKGKGRGRARAGDVELDDNPPAYPARTSQTKRPRDGALQVDERSSDVQTPSSLVDRPSNRSRLPSSMKKPAYTLRLPRMPPPRPRSFRSVNQLMQDHKLRGPREVVLECRRCTEKSSATRPCLTVRRLCCKTNKYELSGRCMRCIIERQKCEWPAGAISKNAEHRMRVSTTRFIEDQSVAAEPQGPTSTQSSASGGHVAINSSHKNTVKATSSARPTPGPSSATATKQPKHTSRINPQLFSPKRSTSPNLTHIIELL